jgi:hypothetical protein
MSKSPQELINFKVVFISSSVDNTMLPISQRQRTVSGESATSKHITPGKSHIPPLRYASQHYTRYKTEAN